MSHLTYLELLVGVPGDQRLPALSPCYPPWPGLKFLSELLLPLLGSVWHTLPSQAEPEL